MPFVKLDCGILDSTLWVDQLATRMFVTALLMAEPYEVTGPTAAIEVRSIKPTGFVVQPGWYGFVRAAGVGIAGRARMDTEAGLDALERLASPDQGSRSSTADGRRLVRVDGGFVVLNYMKYREWDKNAAKRMRLLRAKRRGDAVTAHGDAVTPNGPVTTGVLPRTVTEVEVEVEAEVEAEKEKSERARARSTGDPSEIAAQLTELGVLGIAGTVLKAKDLAEAFRNSVWGDLAALAREFPGHHSIVWLTKKAIARKELWDKARRAGCTDEQIAETIAFKGKVELGIETAIGQLQDSKRLAPLGANGQRAPEACRTEAPSLAKKAAL